MTSDHPDTMKRGYVCTECDSPVRAEAFTMGAYPNGFHVACECTALDSCPAEMTQAETPDTWQIQRPDCCADVPIEELERVYGDQIADRKCPDCGATYRWDGTLSEFPPTTPSDMPPSNQQTL